MWPSSGLQTRTPAQTKTPSPAPPPAKRLRSACDSCHHAKMRCSGGVPCAGCSASKQQCCYSVPDRIGRPKGTKNKKTLRQSSQLQARRSQSTTETEPQQIPTDASIDLLPVTPVNMPERSQPTFAGNSLSSFDNMIDSGSSDPQPLPYSLADSDSPYWDASYDFMREMAIDGGQRTPEVNNHLYRSVGQNVSECMTDMGILEYRISSRLPRHSPRHRQTTCLRTILYHGTAYRRWRSLILTDSPSNQQNHVQAHRLLATASTSTPSFSVA
jgi:hypothetical protein